MTLVYAIDALYEAGFCPTHDMDLETLPDGRAFPSVLAVQNEFAKAGFELAIKHNLVFNCYRATWSRVAPNGVAVEHGTVVGATELEAAVYALAQLLASRTATEQPVA